MSEHYPHPLVVALAGGLRGDKKASQTADSLAALWPSAQWDSAAGASGRTEARDGEQQEEQGQNKEEVRAAASQLADDFVSDSTLPGLMTFVGYVGGTLDLDERGKWQYFYLDRTLRSWILIEAKHIVTTSRVRDDKQPFRCGRDTIWLRSFEPVISGDTKLTTDEISARIFRREFTLAAKVVVSVRDSEPTGSGAFYPGRD